MTDEISPVWFVTGCSTGFGRELAKLVLDEGLRCVITARDVAKVQDLVQGHEDNALILPLDVTKPDQVRDAVKQAEDRFGRIDVLVNNAGYGYSAAIEEGEDAEVRAMFETNFFGLTDMIKAVLPGMRDRKSGHILNVSSIGGLTSFPGTGYYCATKFAVEGLSESLYKELAPLGIRVTIIEPGPFRTDWAGRSHKKSANEIPDYQQTAGARYQQMAGYSGKQPGDPARAAGAMLAVTRTDNPPLHLILGKPGLEFVRKKLNELQKDIIDWEDTTLGADYPEAASA